MTDAPEPFTWGANGARMTPEQIAASRKVADALALQAGDGSPFPVGTRGAGLVTQGLARVAKGVSAGLDYREADAADKANASDNAAMIASLLGGGQSAPVASAAAPVAAVASPAPAAAVAPVAAPSSSKIYSNDEPSPLDPPSGADRVKMIATILGEENTPAGQAGVANVIRNRAVDGGYGGDTPSAVVTAPNQFEPWNTPEGRQRMAAATSDPKQVAAANAAIRGAYGEGGNAPEDPTEGKTMFYAPAAQAALGRAPPSWAQGPGQTLGHTAFYDEPEDAPGVAAVAKAAGAPAPVQVASNDPTAGVAAPVAAASPAVVKVAGAMNPAVMQALTSPYSSESTKKVAGLMLQQQLAAAGKEHYTQETAPDGTIWNINSNGQRTVAQAGKDHFSQNTDAEGNTWSTNNATGQRTVALKADADPTSVKEYEYYKKNLQPGAEPMDYATWSTAKARAGATNVSTNVDMGTSQTYDKQLAEGLGRSHAALANGVEDAQSRARDIAAMQGAVDAIQKNGGTTGGMLPAQRLELQKSINAGASALGIDKPFDENDISDKEFLTKFNRTMAGAQAKNAVGSRVTNFEMSNFLKANPGLDMSITGNQRLLGIQGQIEQRNIAVGNAIRDATAQAISTGKKIDPVTVQGIITNYDKAHHITDVATGQDLTQSYALPEFQTQGNNPTLAAQHETNVGKIRTWHPDTGVAP